MHIRLRGSNYISTMAVGHFSFEKSSSAINIESLHIYEGSKTSLFSGQLLANSNQNGNNIILTLNESTNDQGSFVYNKLDWNFDNESKIYVNVFTEGNLIRSRYWWLYSVDFESALCDAHRSYMITANLDDFLHSIIVYGSGVYGFWDYDRDVNSKNSFYFASNNMHYNLSLNLKLLLSSNQSFGALYANFNETNNLLISDCRLSWKFSGRR